MESDRTTGQLYLRIAHSVQCKKVNDATKQGGSAKNKGGSKPPCTVKLLPENLGW